MKNKDNNYYYTIVRKNIKKYRIKANLTQQELAEKTGFTYQYIRDLESLAIVRCPRLDTLAIISEALNISIKNLFDGIE